MQWDQLLNGLLGSSPLAAAGAYSVLTLWNRLKEKDAQIAALQDARLEDLKTILRQNDS